MQRKEGAGAGLEEPGEKRKGARAASPQERLSFPNGRASFFLRVRGEKSMAGIKLGMRCVLPLMCAAKAMGGCGFSLLCAVKLRKVVLGMQTDQFFLCGMPGVLPGLRKGQPVCGQKPGEGMPSL